jgi:signal transduction histidine kinase
MMLDQFYFNRQLCTHGGLITMATLYLTITGCAVQINGVSSIIARLMIIPINAKFPLTFITRVRGSLSAWSPISVLILFLTITWLLWEYEKKHAVHEFQIQFDSQVHEVVDDIKKRIHDYEYVLRGARGLFEASSSVERDEFRSFVKELNLDESYPGIQAVGYSLIVPSAQKNKHITAIRKQGFSNYTIKPESERDIYTSVVYIEPFSDRNQRAFGYDMYSDQDYPQVGDSAPGLRRAAMERARDSGKVAITGKVRLLMEIDKDIQSGFLMYLPIYTNELPHDTIGERRANIIGWAYAPFRMKNLMRGIFGEHVSDIGIEIYDGDKVSDKMLMYGTDHSHGRNEPWGGMFKTVKHIDFYGNTWTLVIYPLSGPGAKEISEKAQFFAYGGVIVSLLLALLAWSLVQGRDRAENAARKMNKELILSEARARRISQLYKMLSETNSANIHITGSDILFNTACMIAMESGLFRMVWIGLLQDNGDVIPAAHAGHVDGFFDGLEINIHHPEKGNGPIGRVIKSGGCEFSNNIAEDLRMQPWREQALKNGYRATAVFALTQAGRGIGVFVLYFGNINIIDDDIIQTLRRLASDISFSLEFIAESQQRERLQRELGDLSMHLQSALEDERKRISRELHDELGQTLTAMLMELSMCNSKCGSNNQDISNHSVWLKQLTNSAIGTVREISTRLRPAILDYGLEPAVQWLIDSYARHSAIQFKCDLAIPQEYILDEERITTVFRVLQESLTNVVRHANASTVRIVLDICDGNLVMEISDDGVGFNAAAGIAKGRYGLMGMKERALRWGGTLMIDSSVGKGMRVSLTLPLSEGIIA